MIDWAEARSIIAKLAERDWPEEWGTKEEEKIGDFFGWCHRYRLEEPATPEEVVAFERAYGVTLPEEYKAFLTILGNGGAGPYFGINPLGEGAEEPLRPEILSGLCREFQLREAWNDIGLTTSLDYGLTDDVPPYFSDELLVGAMPISTEGCARDYWLVVTGQGRGEIWLDKRTDGTGVEPVIDADGEHRTWYMAWLKDASLRRGVR